MATLETIVPTTVLQAVNGMLSVVGEAPVDNLTAPLPAHVELATNLLDSTFRGIMSRGWQFNSLRSVAITRDGSNYLPIPAAYLRVRKALRTTDAIDLAQRDFDIQQRGLFLWNGLTNLQTFIGSAYTTVYVDVVTSIDFTSCPETLRQYVFIAASRRYQEHVLGNPDLSSFTKADEAQALANLQDAEGIVEDPNALKNLKDTRRANEVWEAVSREVQSQGWHFNSRFDVALTPSSGTISTPTGTLRCVKAPHAGQSLMNVAHRGSIMYDVENDTATFDTADLVDGVLYVDLVMYLAYTYLPESFKRYIDIKAARQMQPEQGKAGGGKVGYTERDEYLAKAALQDDQGLITDNSLLLSTPASNIMLGRSFPRGSGSAIFGG